MRFRSQSAMEYLMTYGWAVLIIAVVLAVLYSLGLFNSATWVRRASPGSCKVFRTAAVTTLEGVCNNVIPRSVAQFNGGATSDILVASIASTSSITVSAWVYSTIANIGSVHQGVVTMQPNDGSYPSDNWQLTFFTAPRFLVFSGGNGYSVASSSTVSTNGWYYLTGTYNGASGILSVYVNGVPTSTTLGVNINTNTNTLVIGDLADGSYGFIGSIADVQIYNTSLDANQVQALYMEGIGGVPVNLQHIVGWWPLNGDFNDYSGNGNNGVPGSVTFTSSWTSGYTTP